MQLLYIVLASSDEILVLSLLFQQIIPKVTLMLISVLQAHVVSSPVVKFVLWAVVHISYCLDEWLTKDKTVEVVQGLMHNHQALFAFI